MDSRKWIRIPDSLFYTSKKVIMDSGSDSILDFGFFFYTLKKVQMDSDSDSQVINLVGGQMDSQNGFGFAVYVLKRGLVGTYLQHREPTGNLTTDTNRL